MINSSISKQTTQETVSSSDGKGKKYMIKVVILGDVNVGKSNIIRRILGQDFQELEATVGVEFGLIDVKDADPDDPNTNLSVQIWDTSGAERYRAITMSHIRNADGAFLVFDLTSEASFEALDFWNDSIKKSTGDDIVIHLVGNKSDLISERKVSRERAVNFAVKYNLQGYSECSAKNNINIKDTFETFYKNTYKAQKPKLDQKTKEMKRLLEGKNKTRKLSVVDLPDII